MMATEIIIQVAWCMQSQQKMTHLDALWVYCNILFPSKCCPIEQIGTTTMCSSIPRLTVKREDNKHNIAWYPWVTILEY